MSVSFSQILDNLHICFQQFQHEINLIKEDVGLRATDAIREYFENVSLDMVTVLWVQQLFPSLMDLGKAVCGRMNMIVCKSYSCQFCSPFVKRQSSIVDTALANR